jgi:DNA-3-methyladenine glycosylase II
VSDEPSQDPIDALRADDRLGPVVEAHGPVTLEPHPEPFERLVTAIVRQQVSMASAAAIRERLFDAVSVTPAGILSADEATLREAGLSASKAEYVKNVARAWRERPLDREHFADVSDAGVIETLTDIRGVGPWTAKIHLLFCLGREDVFPVEDLGIRQGMQRVVDSSLDRREMPTAAERWAPYRSYASLYLWRVTEDEALSAVLE